MVATGARKQSLSVCERVAAALTIRYNKFRGRSLSKFAGGLLCFKVFMLEHTHLECQVSSGYVGGAQEVTIFHWQRFNCLRLAVSAGDIVYHVHHRHAW